MAPGYLLQDVFDPTGAGDCFAGGFIGYLAGQGVNPRDGNIPHNELRRAVIYGSPSRRARSAGPYLRGVKSADP